MIRKLEKDPIYNTNVLLLLLTVALLLLGVSWWQTVAKLAPITHSLERTVVNIPDRRTADAIIAKATYRSTWGKRLKSSGPMLYANCLMDANCPKYLRTKPVPVAGIVTLLSSLLALGLMVAVSSMQRRKRDQLDTAAWLKMDEYEYPELSKFTEGVRDNAGVLTEPVIVNLGYVIEQLPMPTANAPRRVIRYKTHDLKQIGLTSAMLNEHVLVFGSTGTGKTSRVLYHFFKAFALRGDAVVVVDFKFGKIRGSFMETMDLFRRVGMPVYPIVPYEVGGYHIPIFESIKTHQQGRDLAIILIPEAEYSGSSGATFYQKTQQIILGSVIKVVADSPTPNFSEVKRIMLMPQTAFEHWLSRNGDVEAKNQLQRFMEEKGSWNSFVTGIMNALEPFDDVMVSHTFASVPGKNFSVEKFMMQGGLASWCIGLDRMLTVRGQSLTRVFDSWLTNQLVALRMQEARTGPQRDVRKIYDEAPNIGRLQFILQQASVLRDSRISLIFGIQNEDQMKLVYGEDVWAAITSNLGTHVILPTGFKDQAAITLSKHMGEREIYLETASQSAGGSPLSPQQARSGKSIVTQKKPLATPSEIMAWPYFIAVLKTKGTLPPALLALVPQHEERPSYYGLDGRKFMINNKKLYDEWNDLMEVMSDADRLVAVKAIINELVTDEDRKLNTTMTLKDVFNEWVRYAVLDGAAFRRSGDSFEVNFRTVERSLRGQGAQAALRAFVDSSWLNPGKGIEEALDEWGWVTITKGGLAELGPYAQKELSNIRFSSVYIQARKDLQGTGADLGARYEEAREVLPYEAARDATLKMITMYDALMPLTVIEQATDLLMARFEVTETKPIKMVAIPLSMPFERIVPNVIAEAQGQVTLEENPSFEDLISPPKPQGPSLVKKPEGVQPAGVPAPAQTALPLAEAENQAGIPMTTPASTSPETAGGEALTHVPATPDISLDEEEDPLFGKPGTGVEVIYPQAQQEGLLIKETPDAPLSAKQRRDANLIAGGKKKDLPGEQEQPGLFQPPAAPAGPAHQGSEAQPQQAAAPVPRPARAPAAGNTEPDELVTFGGDF